VSSYDFDDPESPLNKEALMFVEELKKNPNCPPLISAIEKRLLYKPTDSISSLPTYVPPTPLVPSSEISTLPEDQINITNFEVDTISDFITTQDFEYFRKIHPIEFLKQGWNQPIAFQVAPNIVAMTSRFNDVGNWVVYEILNRNSPKERLQTILHFLLIGKALQKRNNFNGICAIMSGLNNSSITRLKRTFTKLAKEKNTGLDEMTKLVEGGDNFRSLREMWNNVEPPAIPFLAITLKDLTFLEDGNPDQLEGGGINFYKWRKISEVIQEVLEYQHLPYEPVINQALQTYIQSRVDAAKLLGPQGLFAKSKKCE